MADKLLKYDVAMKSTKTVWQMETPRCYTGDENTVTFDFNITDLEAADLVGVIPNVYLYMRDGSFFQNGPADGVEITGTIVNYTMKGNEGKHSGIARAQLVLVWDDEINPPEKLTSQLYDFEVVSGLENKVAVEVMIQDWTTLTREARTFIDTSSDEVDALKGELQTAINTANASLGEFDVALQNGIVATNIAAELQNLEETYAPDLFTVKKQLADNETTKVGGGVLAMMGDLSQEVKTAMTGGSVAVVGEGAVAKVNLATDMVAELATVTIPYAKDFATFTSVAPANLYIPNHGALNGTGRLYVHAKTGAGTLKIVILEKSTGLNFIVKHIKEVTVTAGEHVIDTGYTSLANGLEYLGLVGVECLLSTGGTGMYSKNNPATLNINDTITFTDDRTTTFQFAVYPEFRLSKTENLTNRVETLETTVELLENSGVGTIELTDFALPNYKEISDPIGFVGRWFDRTVDSVVCKASINAGSELYFKVKNTTTVNINFKNTAKIITPYFAYSIDGGTLVRQKVHIPLITLPDTGEHIIRVVCDGLTEGEDKWIGEDGYAFNNVTLGAGGVLTGVLPKNKLGMYFGDSITEGVYALGGSNDANGNSSSAAFSFISAKKLNAIPCVVGFGGSGVTHGGSGGVPKCLTVIDNVVSTKATPYAEPDFIVLNHGTNDSGATTELFTAEYNAVLNRLKIKYSGVPIFAMIPFNQAKAADIRTCVADKPFVHLIETDGWGVTYVDGVHPNVAGGITAGTKLAEAILGIMGKDYFL